MLIFSGGFVRQLIMLGLVFFGLSPVFGQSMGVLTGEIKDPQGAVIIDAVIIIHADGARPWNAKKIDPKYEDLKVSPNPSSGKYRIELPAGYYYDVMVSSTGFRPQCAKLYMLRTQPNEFNLTLQAGPPEPLMPPE